MNNEKILHKVFVYGTLRRNKNATHKLEGYRLFDTGNFPFIRPVRDGVSKDAFSVLGEVVEVDDNKLKLFDRYENIKGGLYTRETVEAIDLNTDLVVQCFSYVGTEIFFPQSIDSGNWFDK